AAGLRVLILHPLTLARQAPTIAGGQGGREADLVQVIQFHAAGTRFFFKPPSTRLARSTLAGSCLCAKVEAVRREAGLGRLRWRRGPGGGAGSAPGGRGARTGTPRPDTA